MDLAMARFARARQTRHTGAHDPHRKLQNKLCQADVTGYRTPSRQKSYVASLLFKTITVLVASFGQFGYMYM